MDRLRLVKRVMGKTDLSIDLTAQQAHELGLAILEHAMRLCDI